MHAKRKHRSCRNQSSATMLSWQASLCPRHKLRSLSQHGDAKLKLTQVKLEGAKGEASLSKNGIILKSLKFSFLRLIDKPINFRENQTCTKLWLPFCVTFAPFAPPPPPGKWHFPPTGKPPCFLWQVQVFLQDLLCESTIFPRPGSKGQKAKWRPSNRGMLDSL